MEGPKNEQTTAMENKATNGLHTLDDFAFLKAGLSYREISKRVGPADEVESFHSSIDLDSQEGSDGKSGIGPFQFKTQYLHPIF